MKQHISFQQSNELTAEAKEKLIKWLDEKMGQELTGSAFVIVKSDHPEYDLMQRVTIGRMIEFLDESRTGDKKLFPWWNSFFTWDYGGVDGYESEHKEFCDALWEAVKEVLEVT